ncbi:MAG: hypothetical protein LBV67_04260 [Streptococcaceae bacterium]|jgi:hypothetical protein|nr:hypothetical protein [Streptococcaceae bacterium]
MQPKIISAQQLVNFRIFVEFDNGEFRFIYPTDFNVSTLDWPDTAEFKVTSDGRIHVKDDFYINSKEAYSKGSKTLKAINMSKNIL